ncbi:UDP-glycosyltransferase UGT5-like [Euwallacea fornicatus]|uniref:UDP-glycosyltransferase UGT5-like n=1 Tax=Euwallacea fornicatus TaxID=995702 RepID=UPI00338E03D8
MNTLAYFVFTILLLSDTKCSKILGVFPIGGKSLNILYNKLMKSLANAGHDVTVISAYKNLLPIYNGTYHDVLLTGFAEDYNERILNEYHLDLDQVQESYSLFESRGIHDLFLPVYNKTFHHPNVRELLSSNKRFELVIVEHLWSESLLSFSSYYQCPLVVFASMGGINPWVNDIVGNPMPISYVPHYWMVGDFSEGLEFFQRLHNLFYYVTEHILIHKEQLPAQNQLIQQAFPEKTILTAQELYHSPSMVLLGTHSSLRQAAPLSPNMVEIGGFHIDPRKQLPSDIQKFLDEATEGAIYFSMGSHVRSKDFSAEKKSVFLKSFKKLNMRVLWKFEENLKGVSDNVLIKKWVPQTDVLAHPNIKLFITHAGHGSTLETIHYGVPALMIPVFIDQFNNAHNSVSKGFALKLSFSDSNFNEETLSLMIEEMLKNPKYTEKAREISKLFHDRPMKPLDTLVYWTEYVIRNKGAEHLRLGSVRLSWYKLYMVDVGLFIVIVCIFVIYGIVSVYKALSSRKIGSKIKLQ